MSKEYLVRASRDGDQFHYLWAAQRCLRLLSHHFGLVAVSIEGASQHEGLPSTEGDEIVDVAEYYGSEEIEKADNIFYFQLKHSTVQTDIPWPPSGLAVTLEKFANKFKEITTKTNIEHALSHIEFHFVTNRPINKKLRDEIEKAAEKESHYDKEIRKKLERYTKLEGEALASFCRILFLDDNFGNYLEQRQNLHKETNDFLVALDLDAPIKLKELVARKATSESANNPRILKVDVLKALGVTEDHLLPAPSRITPCLNAIAREYEDSLSQKLSTLAEPLVIHAEGGTGKTILAQRIGSLLPVGSVTVLYDCYGNGDYRQPSRARHSHRIALIQIANEIASTGYSYPLLPVSGVDNITYMRAFLGRLQQASQALRAKHPTAKLCVVVDAADNAEMAAKETSYGNSFVKDLLREALPEGVLLVALCRTYRREMLSLQPHVKQFEIPSFSLSETKKMFLGKFPNASDADVNEFHRLTSANPRVQAKFSAACSSLQEVMRRLGPDPTDSDGQIALLLGRALEKLKEDCEEHEKEKIELLCCALSALRPLIPVDILSKISGVQESFIKSFIADMGDALLLLSGTVQFRDEPTESWFFKTFRPTTDTLAIFINNLKEISRTDFYAASVLPMLMLQAGQLDELIQLTLGSSALPQDNPMEKREIEVLRLQHALKACLKRKRYTDSVKLALKAGVETAAQKIQYSILKQNTDLVAAFIPFSRIMELAASHLLASSWLGSHYIYEAGLLSWFQDAQGEARSRCRVGWEWVLHELERTSEERYRSQVEEEDIAELTIAIANISGGENAASHIAGWRSGRTVYEASKTVISRLVTRDRFDTINEIVNAPKVSVYTICACSTVFISLGKKLPKAVLKKTLDNVLKKGKKFDAGNDEIRTLNSIEAIINLIICCIKSGLRSKAKYTKLLKVHLPESPPTASIGSRYSSSGVQYLYAYTLLHYLDETELTLDDLLDDKYKNELDQRDDRSREHTIDGVRYKLKSLGPIFNLYFSVLFGKCKNENLSDEIAKAIGKAQGAYRSYHYLRDIDINNQIALFWARILVESPAPDLAHKLGEWLGDSKNKVPPQIMIKIVQLYASTPLFNHIAIEMAPDIFTGINSRREHTELKLSDYIDLSRAILPMDRHEAQTYFEKAVEVSSKPEHSVLEVWDSMLELAQATSQQNYSDKKLAYQIGRHAEVIRENYIDRDKHFPWSQTIETMLLACPATAIAMFSRWRDRGFGNNTRILTHAVEYIVQEEILPPEVVLPFFLFSADWWNLKEIISLLAKNSAKQKLLDFILSYNLLEPVSPEFVTFLQAFAKHNGLQLPKLPDKFPKSSLEDTGVIKQEEKIYDWGSILKGLDIFQPTDIAMGISRFRDVGFSFNRNLFWEVIFSHIAPGKEVDLINMALDVPGMDAYEYRQFLESIPASCLSRPSVKKALTKSIRSAFEAYSLGSYFTGYYAAIPFELAARVSECTQQELTDIILTQYGLGSEEISASNIFYLIQLMVSKLSKDEASECLEYGFTLFEGLVATTDADGEWRDCLGGDDVTEAVAGYLWSALGDADIETRWEAAHVIKSISVLGDEKVLSLLLEFFKGKPCGAFYDQRFHFYEYAAKQWLLISILRILASCDSKQIVENSDLFASIALTEEHAVIRKLALLIALKVLPEDHPQREKIAKAQCLKIKKVTWSGDNASEETASKGVVDFCYDFMEKRFPSLERCFECPQDIVQYEASKIAHEKWGISGNLRSGADDERSTRRQPRWEDTDYSHSMTPKYEQLAYYFSHNSELIAAGRLAKNYPVFHEKGCALNSYSDWLTYYFLTENTGLWIADRRDPYPLELPAWKINDARSEDWIWSIQKIDFEDHLGLNSEWPSLYGQWMFAEGGNKESVDISSGLIAPEKSCSLVKEWLSAKDMRDYWVPKSGTETVARKFKIEGVLKSLHKDKGIDCWDSWASELIFPAPTPNQKIINNLGLIPDGLGRVWRKSTRPSEPVIRSITWRGTKPSYTRESIEYGTRLAFKRNFLFEILRELKRDLIVKVKIHRSNDFKRNEDYNQYAHPSFRLFIFKANGIVLKP